MSWQRGWGEMTPGTDARPVGRDGTVTLRRSDLDALLYYQDWRGFRRGVTCCLVGAAIGSLLAFALPARADTIHIGGVHINGMATVGTSVTLSPSAEPGVLAVVTMENRHVNDGGDTGSYPLVMDDLAVDVRFIWDADPVLGSDRIVVTPPLGVTCDPEDCGVTVMEGFTGTVVLFDWRGM